MRGLQRRPIICCVTDRARLSNPSVSGLIDHIRAVVDAGVGLVQVREPDLGDRVLTDLVRAAVEIGAERHVPVLVNDRMDVALAAGAAGTHLKEDSIRADRIRALVPAGFIIGRSVHNAEDAEAVAAAGGCDYLLFGTVYASASKPGQPAAGVEALADVCRRVTLPVLAIGGIDHSRVAAVAAAGAAGVAAIGAFITPGQAALDERLRAMAEEFRLWIPVFDLPLIDFFRRGEVARDVRSWRRRARFAPRAHEQLALLVLLSDDPDPEIAAAPPLRSRSCRVRRCAGFLARLGRDERDAGVLRGPRHSARGGRAGRDADEPLVDTLTECPNCRRMLPKTGTRNRDMPVVAARDRADEAGDERHARAARRARARFQQPRGGRRPEQPEADGERSRGVHEDGRTSPRTCCAIIGTNRSLGEELRASSAGCAAIRRRRRRSRCT